MQFCQMIALLTGHARIAHRASYRSSRGMDFDHDIHDWLGGWPYESITAKAAIAKLADLGFACERDCSLSRAGWGVFGTGCDEYVFVKR